MEEIRQAGDADRAEIQALVEAAYAIYLPRMGRRPGPMDDDYAARIAAGQAWVVRDEAGRLLALLVLERQPGFLLVDNVAVAEAGRGGAWRAGCSTSPRPRRGVSATRRCSSTPTGR